MRSSTIIIICFLFGNIIFGQENLSINNKKYYSTFGGVFKVSPILEFEDSINFESKIKYLTENIKSHTIELEELRNRDLVSIPKHFTLFGGLYTKPKLTEKQKQAKIVNNKINKLVYKIKSFSDKRSYNLKNFNELKIKNARYVQKELFWGFIGWKEENENI